MISEDFDSDELDRDEAVNLLSELSAKFNIKPSEYNWGSPMENQYLDAIDKLANVYASMSIEDQLLIETIAKKY